MIGEFGSSIFPPWRFAALVQSSAPNFASRAAVTPVGYVGVNTAALVGVGVGVALDPLGGTTTVEVEVLEVDVVLEFPAPTAST